MAITELIFKPTPVTIGVVKLDASVREQHTASANATRHPIEAEQGSQADVSDHVRVDPLTVEIEGVVTNTPADWFMTDPKWGKDRAQEAYQKLVDSLTLGALVTIKTSLREYKNMVLESLRIERGATKSNALYFNATATEVALVELETVPQAGKPRPVDKATNKKGTKTKTEASAASKEKTSGVKKVIQWFRR
jgi:hypothetical protein